MKNIIIINGHPDPESFCKTLAQNYYEGAVQSNASCRIFHLHEMDFNLSLNNGYRKRTELETCLKDMQNAILNTDHMVFVYPIWWGTYPALLKGFFDRVFLPGSTFKYRDNSLFWDKLLTGKTARLITTMDTPLWYYRLAYGSPGHRSIKDSTLKFCGVNPVRITNFSPIKTSDSNKRETWKKKVYKLGLAQN